MPIPLIIKIIENERKGMTKQEASEKPRETSGKGRREGGREGGRTEEVVDREKRSLGFSVQGSRRLRPI